jgi:hypothetical protein
LWGGSPNPHRSQVLSLALNSIQGWKKPFDEIKAILQGVAKSQAAAEVRMDRAEARMDRMDARLARNEERFEKRMRGFEKLARIGMAELQRFEKETDRRIDALVDAQQRTDASLKALLDSLRKSGNGHHRGPSRQLSAVRTLTPDA